MWSWPASNPYYLRILLFLADMLFVFRYFPFADMGQTVVLIVLAAFSL